MPLKVMDDFFLNNKVSNMEIQRHSDPCVDKQTNLKDAVMEIESLFFAM